ncbi:hypothetical protein G7054_g13071 [Neopestalotiopsis clavispora]|nr:hypothetical protein G7054_g13071 [Neopestalotiopsis clavispora]
MPPSGLEGADAGTKKKKKNRSRTPAQKQAAAERRAAAEAAAAALEQSSELVQKADVEPASKSSSSIDTGAFNTAATTDRQVPHGGAAQAKSIDTRAAGLVSPVKAGESHNGSENGHNSKTKDNWESKGESEFGKKSNIEEKLKSSSIRRLSAQAEVFQPTGSAAPSPSVDTLPGPVFPTQNYIGGDVSSQYSPMLPFTPGPWLSDLGNQFNAALIQQLQSPMFDLQITYSPTFPQQATGFPYQNTQPGSPVTYPQYSPVAPYFNTEPILPSTPLKVEPPRLLTDPREPLNISPKLPPGWVRRFDQEKEKYLYINFHTQEMQWEEPTTAARKTKLAPLPEDGKSNAPTKPLRQDKTSKVSTSGQGKTSQDNITSARFDSADLHHLMKSSAPSRHLTAACLEPTTEEGTKSLEKKTKSIDTNLVPNPLVTFLVDEVTTLTCHLCRKTAMTLSAPSCKVSDEQPMLLPCGHVAGSRCLLHWLATGRDECPFCGVGNFSLRHAKCGHLAAPFVLDRESVLCVPKTLPEGGAFADYCRGCRLERLEVNEVMRVRALKAKVLKAKEVFEDDELPESEEAFRDALRELEELSFLNREKRMGHLCILW